MRNIPLPDGHHLDLYQTVHQLPARRHLHFNAYLVQAGGIGATPAGINHRFARAGQLGRQNAGSQRRAGKPTLRVSLRPLPVLSYPARVWRAGSHRRWRASSRLFGKGAYAAREAAQQLRADGWYGRGGNLGRKKNCLLS